MTMLLIGGIAVFAAGVLAIVSGIPVKEFSLGSTLILAGTVAASAGLLLLGLAMVVRELQTIARRLGAATGARAAAPSGASAGERPGSETRERVQPAVLPSAAAASPTPEQEASGSRDRAGARSDTGSEPAPPETAGATKPRR